MSRADFNLSQWICVFFGLCLSTGVSAQAWVDWDDVTASNLVASPDLGINDVEEKDYLVGDFDHDGDPDLVVVRKLPWTTFGERQNVYFENVLGVLTDQTAQYVPGFLTPDNARDVMQGDFDGDGWEDLIIANAGNSGSNGQQPRIFMNQGVTPGGQWLGFVEEANRLPVLLSNTGAEPNACAVGVGDLTGNGVDDIYLVDYLNDVEDRLLVNNGSGFFADETDQRLPAGFKFSAFATAGMIADINADGFPDIIKNTTPDIKVAYNDGNGFFNVEQELPVAAAYHFDIGDIDADGKNDLYIVQDGQDQFLLNDSSPGSIPVNWNQVPLTNSPLTAGFGGNVHLADLDNDNDLDAAVTDADTDVPSCQRRMAFLQSDGATTPTISDPYNGIYEPAHLQGVFDCAIADFNGDGAVDLIMGHCTGTTLFFQDPPTPAVLPVSNLTCSQSGLDVSLSWSNSQTYSSIEVIKDGTLVATLAGGETSFSDTAPGAGQYSYTLLAYALSQNSPPRSCAIQVSTVNAVSSLTCVQFGEDVQLSWDNNGGITGGVYDAIEVRRSGVLVAQLPGTATGYLDLAPGLGVSLYIVTAFIGADFSTPTSCTLNVAPTDATDLILDFFADDSGATDSALAIEESLVANGKSVNRILLGSVTDLPGLNIDLNDFDRVWVELGTFPNNKVLTAAEGLALADFLTDGTGGSNLYMSGADTFFFDPQTAIHGLNGVTAISDGSGIVANVRGMVGGVCDTTILELVIFDGEDDFVDRLSTTTGEEVLEVNVGGNTFVAGVFQPVGAAAIVSTSLELGGIGAPHDRRDLIGAYLDCLDLPPPPTFVRGDCNGDASLQIPDGIFLLNYLFAFGASPSCFKACDLDDNGSLQLGDPIYLLNYLFASGAAPPAPFPTPGPDPTFDTLSCQ